MIPQASIKRVDENRFSEADVERILLYARENLKLPLLTELGNFVAHTKRSKGIVYSILISNYAKFAYFMKYGRDTPTQPSLSGSCEWWFKPLLMHQLATFNSREIFEALGRKPKEIRREIDTYFPKGEEFPTDFRSVFDDQQQMPSKRFVKIVNFCVKTFKFTNKSPLFRYSILVKEIETLLSKLGLPKERLSDFIVCICILLHQKKYYFEARYLGTTNLRIGTMSKGVQKNLEVWLNIQPPLLEKQNHIGLMLINTTIDADGFFSESLISHSQQLLLSTDDCHFEFNSTWPVKCKIFERQSHP